MSVAVTLVDKSGQEWVAGSAVEINDLLAQGYRIKGHADGATPDRTAPESTPTTDGGITK